MVVANRLPIEGANSGETLSTRIKSERIFALSSTGK